MVQHDENDLGLEQKVFLDANEQLLLQGILF